MKINKIKFKDFMLFSDMEMDFSPHLNVIIGHNGSGKTITLKTLYSVFKTIGDIKNDMENPLISSMTKGKAREKLAEKMLGVFRPDGGIIGRLVKRKRGISNTSVNIYIDNDRSMNFGFSSRAEVNIETSGDSLRELAKEKDIQAVFLPPKEIISSTENFSSIYEENHIAIEETYYDLNRYLLRPLKKGKNSAEQNSVLNSLQNIIKGTVKMRDNKFYLETVGIGEIEMGLEAEGYRKIATLMQLISNGTLQENSMLFWDEPETNLNPRMMKHIAKALIELSRLGIQVFITTHDYFLLQEFSLFAEYEAEEDGMQVNFISLCNDRENGIISSEVANQAEDLENNPIYEEFTALYNREQDWYSKNAN